MALVTKGLIRILYKPTILVTKASEQMQVSLHHLVYIIFDTLKAKSADQLLPKGSDTPERCTSDNYKIKYKISGNKKGKKIYMCPQHSILPWKIKFNIGWVDCEYIAQVILRISNYIFD